MTIKKEYDEYIREILGDVNIRDTEYCNRELMRGVDGQETAEKSILGMVVISVVEIVAILILSQVTDADATFLIILAFYSISKNVVLGAIFNTISSKNLVCRREWNVDKYKLAVTKICLAKMGKLKSDVDLSDFELRNRSRLDDYDIRNFI